MSIVAGLDFSYTSPAITICDNGVYTFYAFKNRIKQESANKSLILFDYPETYSCQEERFDKLTDILFDVIIKKGATKVFLEGYAYGGKGSVFDIAEATGLMKWKLFKSDIPVVIFAPSEIKKFATGKGNSNKFAMLEFFCQQSDHHLTLDDVDATVSETKIGKPLDDIVDSYWICKLGVSKYQQ